MTDLAQLGTLPASFYISGPITGYPDSNRHTFAHAKALLSKWYPQARIVNPLDLGKLPGERWEDYLKRDLEYVLDVDCLATLAGWRESNGASLEVHVAKALRKQVRPLMLWNPANHPLALLHN